MIRRTLRLAGETLPYSVVEHPDDLREFRAWVQRQAAAGTDVGSDSETTGLDWYSGEFRVRLWQFGTTHEAWVIPVEWGGPFAEAVRWALRTLPRLTFQNATFDLLAADAKLGVPLEETYPKVTDTRILAHLTDSRQDFEGGVGLSLKPLAAHYVDPAAEDPQRALLGEFRAAGGNKDTGWAKIDLLNPVFLEYAALDPILCARIRPRLLEDFHRLGVREALIPFEHRIAYVCAKMQRRGLLVDQEYTRDLIERLADEQAQYEALAARYGVTSVNSPKQVAEALQGMGVVLTERTKGGALAVGKEVLMPLAALDGQWQRIEGLPVNPLADAVLRAKRAGKWSTSYAQATLTNLDPYGRVHPSLNPLGAKTGRASVSNPPYQQLPSKGWTIRRTVVADPGHHMFEVDQSSVELVVLAALSGEPRMCQAIRDGRNLHDYTASLMFGDSFSKYQRGLAKIAGLGYSYQGGAATLAKQTGIPVDDMQAALNGYKRSYPGLPRWAKRMQREALANRCDFRTLTGRRLMLDRDKLYKVVAYACQSTARDTMGQALIDMDAKGLTEHLSIWVHDAVIGSAPKADVPEIMAEIEKCTSMDLMGVPIRSDKADFGETWAGGYGLPDEYAVRR
ncbi:DNA polymerase [Kitasatospora purpeofusca]|uniref:DNA polymerase n=1 Tax=Kitasatospora purpeofusca TaxID=67352 RepID=UPI0036748904